MEVKVWMDGYQRVVCGVTEQTTCQDLIIALAQASGVTGRYAMYEKWRSTENCLSPAEYPLLVLRRWGDYSHDVQFILRHSIDGRKVRGGVEEDGGPGGPPGRSAALRKSLTISGAHGRALGVEVCPRNNVGHSVDSSEQSSVASHSSASLSPYTSLERRNCNNSKHEVRATYNGLHKDKDKDKPVESVRTPIPAERHHGVGVAAEKNFSRQNPIPAERHLGVAAEKNFSRQNPTPAERHLAENFSRQNGRPLKPQPADGLKPQVPRPGDQGVAGKELRFNGTKRVSANDNNNNSGSEGTSSSSSPVVSNQQSSKNALLNNRKRPDENDTDLLVTQSSSKAPILGSSILKLVATSRSQTSSGRNPIQDSKIKDPEQQSTKLRTMTTEEQRQQQQQHHASNPHHIPLPPHTHPHPPHTSPHHHPFHPPPPPHTPSHPPPTAKKFQVPKGAWAYPLPHFPPPPPPTPPPDETSTSSSGAIQHPHSGSVEFRSSGSDSGSEQMESTSSGVEEMEREREKEERRRELVELIIAQEQELEKCESRLKGLDCEISLMECDAEVEERHLELQLRKLKEMEALEKEVDSELEELELISWEEKLEMERQKEVRIQTEILLLQSGVEKSEAEIKEISSKTEDADTELSRRLLEKQEIEALEETLQQEKMLLQVSSKSLESLELEIENVDNCLLRKKEDLSGLEDQLKQLNMEWFLKQTTQDTSLAGRSPLLDQLGLLRPERVHRSHVTIEGTPPPPPPLPHRLKCSLVEARSHSPEFV